MKRSRLFLDILVCVACLMLWVILPQFVLVGLLVGVLTCNLLIWLFQPQKIYTEGVLQEEFPSTPWYLQELSVDLQKKENVMLRWFINFLFNLQPSKADKVEEPDKELWEIYPYSLEIECMRTVGKALEYMGSILFYYEDLNIYNSLQTLRSLKLSSFNPTDMVTLVVAAQKAGNCNQVFVDRWLPEARKGYQAAKHDSFKVCLTHGVILKGICPLHAVVTSSENNTSTLPTIERVTEFTTFEQRRVTTKALTAMSKTQAEYFIQLGSSKKPELNLC